MLSIAGGTAAGCCTLKPIVGKGDKGFGGWDICAGAGVGLKAGVGFEGGAVVVAVVVVGAPKFSIDGAG